MPDGTRTSHIPYSSGYMEVPYQNVNKKDLSTGEMGSIGSLQNKRYGRLVICGKLPVRTNGRMRTETLVQNFSKCP